MPQSVTVAAFLSGTLLLLAALIGQGLKIGSIVIPALSGRLRIILGLIGLIFIYIGLLDPFSQPALSTPSASIAQESISLTASPSSFETPAVEPSPTPQLSLTPINTLTPTNTPTPTNTNTSTSTFTSTPIPSPIECDNSRIVPGIFAQLADVTTFSFVNSSENAMFECKGVYDHFNETLPTVTLPTVKIDYESVVGSSASFSIGISDGFDVSEFSKICVWVFAENTGQRFDLKLEDINVGEGVEIFTTETAEWDQHCVLLLDGYPNVDLNRISVITLSFNDSFGSAAIWVDDFELMR